MIKEKKYGQCCTYVRNINSVINQVLFKDRAKGQIKIKRNSDCLAYLSMLLSLTRDPRHSDRNTITLKSYIL